MKTLFDMNTVAMDSPRLAAIKAADITASYGVILEDCGLLFYSETQKEAQDNALAFLSTY